MIFYEAPTRGENYAEERSFAYLAEVDILGWKFRKMADGGAVIDTPRSKESGYSMIAVLSPEHVELLQALLDLRGQDTPVVPDSWENVAKAVRP